MKASVSLIITIICFLARMVIFCSLWLIFFRHPFIQNLFYAIMLFIGGEIILHYIEELINKNKHKHN